MGMCQCPLATGGLKTPFSDPAKCLNTWLYQGLRLSHTCAERQLQQLFLVTFPLLPIPQPPRYFTLYLINTGAPRLQGGRFKPAHPSRLPWEQTLSLLQTLLSQGLDLDKPASLTSPSRASCWNSPFHCLSSDLLYFLHNAWYYLKLYRVIWLSAQGLPIGM